MAIVDRDSVGRVSIMELSVGELIALSNILVAGSKAKEISLDELRKIEGVINGLCHQLKRLNITITIRVTQTIGLKTLKVKAYAAVGSTISN